MNVVDLLDYPVYVMAQVDRLLGLPRGTARRWIDGYRRGGRFYEPVVRVESSGDPIVTWGEFVETRLLSEYRTAGVRLFRLREAVGMLRVEFGRYPLAHAQPYLLPYGRELVRRVQEQVALDRDLRLVVVRNNQAMLSSPAENFVSVVGFDERDVAVRITPDSSTPEVVIDPLRAAGEPVVRAVPTEAVAEQARAGDSPELIADLYELPLGQVQAALRFERRRSA